MIELINVYKQKLQQQLDSFDWTPVRQLAEVLLDAAHSRKQVFICGNGGSAGNAVHLANDFIYGVDPSGKYALNIEALTANTSVLTCLGNDIGYDNIFAHQLKVKAKPDDVLVVLSGSGNSANIVIALQQAKSIGMHSSAILGYSGGIALGLSDIPIHFPIDDMQIAEDLQVIVGHMLMRQLFKQLKDSHE
jgi:D-sedoheptulose 7-phosphate isomerase